MVSSPQRNDKFYRELATEIRSRISTIAPDWTESNHSDPGITLLELLSFIVEGLLYRPGMLPAGLAAAHRLATAALALAASGAQDDGCEVRRVNYFAGQLLNSRDFVDEQDYLRKRLRRRNRQLHGTGIVSGLGVSIAAGAGDQGQVVLVKPGFALDPQGEEIEVCAQMTAPIPGYGKTLLVQLQFSERPAIATPAVMDLASDPDRQFTRVEETADLLLAPALRGGAVALARMIFKAGKWRVDRTFKPKRARR